MGFYSPTLTDWEVGLIRICCVCVIAVCFFCSGEEKICFLSQIASLNWERTWQPIAVETLIPCGFIYLYNRGEFQRQICWSKCPQQNKWSEKAAGGVSLSGNMFMPNTPAQSVLTQWISGWRLVSLSLFYCLKSGHILRVSIYNIH